MRLLSLFLFLGSALSYAINFADTNTDIDFTGLVAEFELNILLINHVTAMEGRSRELTMSLLNLRQALNNFADTLYKPEVMIYYCGKSSSKEPIHSKLLSKYQIDTINPFAEAINYKALDLTKFSMPIKNRSINLDVLKRIPDFLEEFDILTRQNVQLFLNPGRSLTDGMNIRISMKGKLEKFIIRRIREYLKDKGTNAPQINGSFNGLFDLAVSIYFKNG